MKYLRHSLCAAGLIAALSASSASAALVQFTDRAQFDAATTAQTVEPNSAPPGSYTVVGLETINGITYPDYAYMVDPDYAPELYQWGTGPVLLLENQTSLSFAPVTAFAADFGSLGEFGATIQITIDGVTQALPTFPGQQLSFYGFTSDTPFTSVTLSAAAQYLILDNVTLATAVETPPVDVPEPQSLALMGLALAGLALARRQRA